MPILDGVRQQVTTDISGDVDPDLGGELDASGQDIDDTTRDLTLDASGGSNIVVKKALKRTNEGYIWVKGGDTDWDYTQATLSVDSNWHELDLSSIVSATAKAVVLFVAMKDGSAGMLAMFMENGYSYYEGALRTPEANTYDYEILILGLDGDKKIKYYIQTGTDELTLKVLGWFE